MSPLFALAALAAQAQSVSFDWFEYTGRDAVFEQPLQPGEYRNPILAGFYPDPSITRVGDKFYLVNSTFAYFPGIPIFESTDLVNWKQIGHVIDRPSQLKFDGLAVSQGVFAPTIEYHNGTFYRTLKRSPSSSCWSKQVSMPESPLFKTKSTGTSLARDARRMARRFFLRSREVRRRQKSLLRRLLRTASA